MINYTKGDVTKPVETGKKVLVHIVNNYGGWGAGVVLAISKKWKLPEQKYREWSRSGKNFSLGEVQFVKVNADMTIANMLAQDGYGGLAVKYQAVRDCLKKVCELAKKEGRCVVMPRIGCGLGGGDFGTILKIIEEELDEKGVQVTIYTL